MNRKEHSLFIPYRTPIQIPVDGFVYKIPEIRKEHNEF